MIDDQEGSTLLAELFNRMTREQKNSVPPDIAERIGKYMDSHGYSLVFEKWHKQREPNALLRG